MSKRTGSTITSFFKATKIRKTSQSSTVHAVGRPLVSFDKQKWLDELTGEQRELLQLEINTLDESWLAVLHPELTKPYFLQLKKFLQTQKASKKVVFPPEEDIYSWSRLTPLQNVSVVILGQDPYHNYNQAHGLAFSVNPPTKPPPSLVNIYKGIKACYKDFEVPASGLLTDWSKQGVLMLNTCLTVEAHKANSHANQGWEQFTGKVLETVVKYSKGVCFLAWGSPAGKRVDGIKPGKEHLVLRSVHPSPLSAHRGFFEQQHFKKVNDWLYEKYGADSVINWALVNGNKLKEIEEMKMDPEEREEAAKAEKERLEAFEREKAQKELARKEAESFLLAHSSDIEDLGEEDEEKEKENKPASKDEE